MNKLNRKEYKNQIKIFRNTHKIAQIQHQWVKFRDDHNKDVIMFVHGSNIVRTKSAWRYLDRFDVGPHKADVELFGWPSISFDHTHGLTIDGYTTSWFKANKDCEFKILNDDEVIDEYNKLFENAQKMLVSCFKEKLKKNK